MHVSAQLSDDKCDDKRFKYQALHDATKLPLSVAHVKEGSRVVARLDPSSNGVNLAATIIEIRPHHWGWKVFEAPGVEPVFPQKDEAIDYAQARASFRSGEIRVLDSTGNVERTIAFSEADRKL